MNFNHRDSESITDVCPDDDLPEVELVSMLEEQLPQYKLRVDSLYLSENEDWIQSPSHHSHAPEITSPVLAEETFRYMTLLELPPSSLAGSHRYPPVLGTDSREQVVKNCNDVEVVTHLLAERDRDLELAARIGQALLKRNHILTEQNEALEEQLGQAFDKVHQLQHELTKKDELLRVVSIASEESETDSSCSTPLRFNESFHLTQGLLQLDMLQDKLREMEEENLALRTKACHLKTETMSYEEKEQQLVSDCVKEIRETNAQIVRMSEELTGKNEELLHYQEEISSLLAQIVDLQHKIKEHVIEKEELKLHLQASKDAQRQLTAELHDLQERNAECLGMLHESQEEVKRLRSKASHSSLLCHPQSCGAFPGESLAAEIEGTMRKELSLGDESVSKQKIQQKRVFDTVRAANDTRSRPAPLPIPGSNRSSVVMTSKPFHSGLQHVEGKAHPTQRSNPESVSSRDDPKLGRPGAPGEDDVATALHRLTLRRQNYLSEKQFFEEEWERRMRLLADQKGELACCSTPAESCLSLGSSSELTDFSSTSSSLRSLLPEKLQIVKPLEGSQTLFHWQQLAQPNLGTILDPRPGVVTKGFTPLSQDDVYHLSDLEEDEEEMDEGITFQVQPTPSEERKPAEAKSVAGIFLPPVKLATAPPTASNPGKCLSSTNSTFTFTTCRILHPSDITQVTPRYLATQIPRSADMSRANFTNCPCWDPWKIGCKRLTRTRTGTLASTPRSCPIGAGVKDRSKSLQLPVPSRMKFIPGTHKLPLRSREPQDISKDFTQLPPGFLLSHMKGQLSITLEEEFFEKERPSDTTKTKPILASTPPNLQTEDVVADLVEQISELTGIIEQLRRDHETSHKQLENEMEEKCNDLKEEHESKIKQLEAHHKSEMNALEEEHKKELRTERATAQEKLSMTQGQNIYYTYMSPCPHPQ